MRREVSRLFTNDLQAINNYLTQQEHNLILPWKTVEKRQKILIAGSGKLKPSKWFDHQLSRTEKKIVQWSGEIFATLSK